MTDEYPVHYTVERPAKFERVQLALRVVAFFALGLLRLSLGTLFAVAYVALPVIAASRIASRGPAAYLEQDGPRVTRLLAWIAAIGAWAGLVTDRLPASTPDELVTLAIPRTSHPSTGHALARVITGLPSAIVLALLGCLGALVWLWAAITILVGERVGPGAFGYLAGLQRWSMRLLAYQASLVDEYPPFSFTDVAPPHVPAAQAAP